MKQLNNLLTGHCINLVAVRRRHGIESRWL